MSHCGFDLHFPVDYWGWAPFHIYVDHLYVFLGRMSVHVICPFFFKFFSFLFFFFFAVDLYEFFIYFEYLPHQIRFAIFFSHFIHFIFIFFFVAFAVKRFLVLCSPTFLFFVFVSYTFSLIDFPDGSGGKASAYNVGDPGSIPGSGRSPGKGNGNPLQCSCLENPMDWGTRSMGSMGSQRVGHNWVTSLSLLVSYLINCYQDHLVF